MNPQRLSELWSVSEVDDSAVVLSESRLSLNRLRLNRVGAEVWRFCDGSHSLDEIVDKIALQIDDSAPSRPDIRRDVAQFLAELRSEGLISWDPENPATDVLLVVPPFPTTYAPEASQTPEYSAPPLGLGYIAAVLREHGFRVAIVDLHIIAGQPEDIIKECRRRRPAIVGITAATPSYPNAVRVARFVKAYDTGITTVLGGSHATTLPEQCARSGVYDFVCVGEGEQPMVELCEAVLRGKGDPYQLAQLAHIGANGQFVHRCHLGDGQVPSVTTGHPRTVSGAEPYRPRMENLDVLPMPARDLLDIDRYFKKGAIVSARGCPIECNFCACAAIVGRTYRPHSVVYVLDEVEHVMRTYGYRFFDFHDDTFNLHKQRVFDFCQAIRERELDFEWGCFCRAAQFTPQMAEAMAGAGCRVVQFGVEAGNDAMLKSIKKATTIRQIEEAVQAATAAGIPQIVCGFIIGHADDTEASVRETIAFGLRLRQLGATRLTLSLLTPYPGTEVYLRRNELGIRLLTDEWEQFIFSRVVMETKYLSKDRLRELYVEGLCGFLDALDGGNRTIATEGDSLVI